MTRRPAVALVALALTPTTSVAAPGDGCPTVRCAERVRVEVRARWRAEARPYAAWLQRLRRCESTGNYHAASNPPFRGAYQFDARTWQEVGGRGHVAGLWGAVWADPVEQDVRTVRLRLKAGTGRWPVCGR